MAETDQPLHIAIIGGGFCGILTAIHLLKDDWLHLNIHIINKGSTLVKGVAYDPHTAGLLLNVPNSGMSAFPDMPGHFLQWLIERTPAAHPEKLAAEFSTRQHYGEYLCGLWQDAQDNPGSNKRLNIVDDRAVDIVEDGSRFRVFMNNHSVLLADIVILATGNDKPNFATGLDPSLKKSGRYFGNPWERACVENLSAGDDVLIIGNGLTMVDTVIGLAEKGCTAVIHTISPHGYRLKPWKEAKEPYTDLAALSCQDTQLIDLVKTLNKHRKIADRLNQSIYPVVDSLRPRIQTLWLSFSVREKHLFIKNLSPLWDRIRHRLPVQMHNIIEDMRTENKLVSHTGHIISAIETGRRVDVVINCGGCLKILNVQRIINCTGPETNIMRSGNVLLSNMANSGLICPGPFNLGINTHPADGSVITANAVRKHNLFVIGNNLKGMLWESTAVPELRVQAKKLAQHILTKVSQKDSRAVAEN